MTLSCASNADLFGQSSREAAIDALHAATALYTVEPVVDDLLDRLDWPRHGRRLVDPSCGDGMFLDRALRRALRAGLFMPDMIEGWELHPFAAEQARHRVARTLAEAGRRDAFELAQQIVRNADFLTEGPTEPRYDVIAGNPPYLCWVNVPGLLRAEYESVVPKHARADLLHSFLDRCAEVLTADGEIGMVTADRWLFNIGAAGLRTALGQRLGIDHLERLDPATAFYRPKQRRAGSPPRIHPVSVVLRAPTASSIVLGGTAVYPDGQAEAPAGSMPLSAIAQVRLSPWLGGRGIFVVDEVTARKLPPECLVPTIDTDDVVHGILQKPKRFAVRTEPDVEPPASVMAHLDAELPRMAKRGRRHPRWLPPETFHALDLSQPSLMVPRIAKTLRPVRIPPGIMPFNHNLMIVHEDQAVLDRIEQELSSARAQDWMRTCAARLENGYHAITTTLLRRFPVVP